MRLIIICALIILLTGCGFHLRGEIPLAPPLHKIFIQSKDPYGQLSRNLRGYFKMSHVCVVDNICCADTVLTILREDEIQQLLSVSDTVQTRQYSLMLSVTFGLTDKRGLELIPPQTVGESRTLTIQSNKILGGSNEATNLYQLMRRAIVFDIMNRLSSQEITAMVMQKCH